MVAAAGDEPILRKQIPADGSCNPCGSKTTLNDLDYYFPAVFSRCQLRARGPNQKEISPEQRSMLAEILGTPLRLIWTHY